MPRQYFFWKYLNTIIVLYCITVQKSPIFVQLSPIQCTYSNIFIRFFKFSPANTNILQNLYREIGVLCGLRQGVLSLRAYHSTLIVLRATHYLSLRGIANGDAVAISRKGNLVIKPCATHFMSFWGVAHYGDSKRYFVLLGKRRTQAKEWALLPAIMWFQKCSVRRIARKGTIL